MTRYLLDTNIISNVIKPTPSDSLLVWLGEQIEGNSPLLISIVMMTAVMVVVRIITASGWFTGIRQCSLQGNGG